MSNARPSCVLSAAEGPAVECVTPTGRAPLVLVCEHASAFIPEALNGLGLSAADRQSHAAWDPGAARVARAMSAALDAPLIAARVSRLVYDCNRPPDAPGAMTAQSETIEVPGNRGLSAADKAQRTQEIYAPFHAAVEAALDARAGAALVTVHSFNPTWFGKPRDAEMGLLHDADPELAEAMLHEAALAPCRVALNVPYCAADGVTHTLARHGTARGIANVMIEIRNDLITDDAAVQAMAAGLVEMLRRAYLDRQEAAE